MPIPSAVSTDDIPLAKLHSAHDRFFRRVFSNPRHARGMLQRVLPVELAASLDWSTLRLIPGSHLDEVLGATASDLLFEVMSRSAGRVLVYLLMEHQSTQDWFMPLRLLGYAGRCLADYVRSRPPSKEPIPRLVPVVVYQGPQPWTAPRRLSELCEPRPEVHELVELELIVHELGAEDAEALAAAHSLSVLARAALVAMKLVAAQADLEAHAALLGRLLREVRLAEGVPELRPLVTYLLRTRGNERELRAIMQATDSQTRVIVQTAYERLIERGQAEGRAEGEAEGKAQGRAEGKAQMLLQLVQARFGAVPPVVHDRIHDARADQLDRWAQRLLTASTLDELFVD